MKNLNDSLEKIRQGDEAARNNLIDSYQPFILNKIVAVTGQYVEKENDDVFLIGLMAFNEAIDHFNPKKGTFLSFAALKIRQRVIDFKRQEHRHEGHETIDNPGVKNLVSRTQLDLQLEIELFKKALNRFHITLDDLVKQGPKQGQTRKEVTKLGVQSSKEKKIVDKLYKNKRLPCADIALRFQASKKRLKLFKTFITGVILVCHEQLETIKEYLVMEDDNYV